jgi:hypothetical protein
MRLKVEIESRNVESSIKQQLEQADEMFSEVRGMTGALVGKSKIAGNAIALFPILMDAVVDEYVKRVRESAEPLYADYYCAKAYAFALAGRTAEGRLFLDKATHYRTGGKYWDLCRPYYVSK